MGKRFKERHVCVDHAGKTYHVDTYENVHLRRDVNGDQVQYVGKTSACLDDKTAVMIVAEGVYRVVWNQREIRSVSIFGSAWGNRVSEALERPANSVVFQRARPGFQQVARG